MAISGSNSKIAIAKQTAKGTAGVGGYYVDAVSPQFAVADNVRMRRPHIGDSPFMRGAYKVGVGVPVGASFEATPNLLGTVLNLGMGQGWSGQWFKLEFTGTISGGTFTLGSGAVNTANITYVQNTGVDAKTIEDALMATTLDGTDERFIVSKLSPTLYYIGWVGKTTVTGKTMSVEDGSLTGAGATATITNTTKSAHLIRFDPSNKYEIPWFSAWRSISDQIKERAIDAKMATIELGFTAADAVICNFAGAALKPEKVNGSTVTMMSDSYDVLPVYTVMDGAHASLVIDNVAYGTNEGGNKFLAVSNVGFSLNNNLTPMDQRYRIGSKFPNGLDILSRDVAVQMAVEIENGELYEKIYYSGTDWNEAVMQGSVSVAAATQAFGTDNPKFVEMHARNVMFSGLLIPQQPRRMVVGMLNAAVVAGSNTSSEVEFYLFNEDSTL